MLRTRNGEGLFRPAYPVSVALEAPGSPAATGVIYCDPAPEYVEAVRAQRERVRESGRSSGAADLDALLRSGHTWRV